MAETLVAPSDRSGSQLGGGVVVDEVTESRPVECGAADREVDGRLGYRGSDFPEQV